MAVKCPLCSKEVEYFYRKYRSGFLACPSCQNSFRASKYPDLQQYVKEVKSYPWEEVSEMPKESKEESKTKTPELFPTPKPPEEIIAEVLEEWQVDERFIEAVTKYVQRKGYLDPGWLLNMLLEARTGRKFSQQEAFMVVDEIVSEIEKEREKAEKAGRQYFFSVMPFGRSSTTYYSPAIPLTSGEQPRIYTSYQQPHPTTTPTTQYQYQPYQYQQPYSQPILTKEDIAKIIDERIGVKTTQDSINELRKQMAELEKARIEDKANLEKMITNSISSLKEEIKNTIASYLSNIQPSQKTEETLTRKDLELIFEKREKDMMEKIHELEKKYLESKSEAEKKELVGQIDMLRKEIEHIKSQPTTIVSPEGWQKDETRLVAQLGSELLSIAKERKPVEYLIRIMAQPKQPQEIPKEEIKTKGKGLIDLIKEMGGAVE